MTDFIIVTGGRKYTNRAKVYSTLNALSKKPLLLIQGGANGADRLARQWAEDFGVQSVTFSANWKYYGDRAGPIRNGYMIALFAKLKDSAQVIAFPGGSGTASCVGLAQKVGIEVCFVEDT